MAGGLSREEIRTRNIIAEYEVAARITGKYVAVDVEASGPTPMNYSMLSFGACEVGNKENRFYRELKPISRNYNREAMLVACKGLEVLKRGRIPQLLPWAPSPSKYEASLNVNNPDTFSPKNALKELRKHGIVPKQAMKEFRDWLKAIKGDDWLTLSTDCPAFDGMFVHCYFDKFGVENPFVYGGESLDSMYKGFIGDPNANIEDAEYWRKLSHNGLEDSVDIATVQEELFRRMKLG